MSVAFVGVFYTVRRFDVVFYLLFVVVLIFYFDGFVYLFVFVSVLNSSLDIKIKLKKIFPVHKYDNSSMFRGKHFAVTCNLFGQNKNESLNNGESRMPRFFPA